jgi:hypothetical protein
MTSPVTRTNPKFTEVVELSGGERLASAHRTP